MWKISHFFVHLSDIHMSIPVFMYLCIYYPSLFYLSSICHLSVYLSILLSINQSSIHPTICLSVWLVELGCAFISPGPVFKRQQNNWACNPVPSIPHCTHQPGSISSTLALLGTRSDGMEKVFSKGLLLLLLLLSLLLLSYAWHCW